jgi:ribonuclease HI
MVDSLKPVTIYTDGACSGNPGAGGYGIVLMYQQHRKELSGGFRLTTNNRMEMMAAIVGLEALKFPCHVKLYTDSRYLVDAMTQGWAKRWQANGWKRNKKEMAKNPDLWQTLLELCDGHQVEFAWVKGHAGDPENECCDRLAVAAAQVSDLPPDLGYEEVSA